MKIVINNVSKNIHGSMVLKNVNMEMNGGAVYGMLGKNGSGKTMLMRAICGLIKPSEGTIEVNGKIIGKDISSPPDMGMILETPIFLPDRTGFQNLRLIASILKKANDSDIYESLERVGLDPSDRRKVRKYSLGMRQRLGIACAIMENPSLLILDEPFNGLDEAGSHLLQQIICEYRDQGCLIILACHDRSELEFLSDYIFQVSAGTFSLIQGGGD